MKILVTGGTNGMGKGLAQILAGIDNQMHEIIILCRSEELGKTTLEEIERTTGNGKLSTVLCDLTRLNEVRNAIKEIHEKHNFLDGIFINAGLGYASKRVETEDGMDPHFQVNYLSQFLLTLNLLDLLQNSENGGRVIFNVTQGGRIFWDDMQMEHNWGYVRGIQQAMVAKRLMYTRLNDLFRAVQGSNVSFYGFQISKTVWSNQITIIPTGMKTMAKLMKFLGTFISIEECGRIMAPLFTESQTDSIKKSGKMITWKKKQFVEMKQDKVDLSRESQQKLWEISLDLCKDAETRQIASQLTKDQISS